MNYSVNITISCFSFYQKIEKSSINLIELIDCDGLANKFFEEDTQIHSIVLDTTHIRDDSSSYLFR